MDIEFVRSRFIKHFDGKTGNYIKIYGTDYADADKGRICKKLSWQ